MTKGRPLTLSAKQLHAARVLYVEERLSIRSIADALGVSHMTIYRALQRKVGE